MGKGVGVGGGQSKFSKEGDISSETETDWQYW